VTLVLGHVAAPAPSCVSALARLLGRGPVLDRFHHETVRPEATPDGWCAAPGDRGQTDGDASLHLHGDALGVFHTQGEFGLPLSRATEVIRA
jgi:hypothetical protein